VDTKSQYSFPTPIPHPTALGGYLLSLKRATVEKCELYLQYICSHQGSIKNDVFVNKPKRKEIFEIFLKDFFDFSKIQ
jgi:hypothetical protein